MTVAQQIKQVWEQNHTSLGFCSIDPIIAAGFEWEVAHFVESANSASPSIFPREDAYAFMDKEPVSIEMHIDTLALMIGKKVIDADNTYVVFADGSALAANGWGQTFWHPIEKFSPNDDHSFDGEA